MAGQALVPVVVSAREKILDEEAYASATSSPIDEYDADDADQRATVPAAA